MHNSTDAPVVLHTRVFHVLDGAAHLTELVGLAGDVLATDIHVNTWLEAHTRLALSYWGRVVYTHGQHMRSGVPVTCPH